MFYFCARKTDLGTLDNFSVNVGDEKTAPFTLKLKDCYKWQVAAQFPHKAFPVSFLVTLGNQLEWGNANSKRVGNEILHSTKSRKY